jgi:hypothetical protein
VSQQPERPKHLELRASDADRERVAKVLHDAMAEGRLTLAELDERLQAVYQSKTLGDLEPLTADLPGVAHSPAGTVAPVPSAAVAQRVTGEKGPSASFAMLSGVDRKGDWALSKFHSVVAIMGGVDLDLTHCTFEAEECTIQIFTLFGGVNIIVPDDITVRITGIGIMGAFDDKVAHDGPPGAPVVTITGLALMAGVDIRRPKKRKRDRKQLQS